MSNYSKDTYALAKGINHIENAIQYFEQCKVEAKGYPKAQVFYNGILNRLNWSSREVKMKIKSPEVLNAIKDELSNSGTMDSINNIVISLPHIFREAVEEYAQGLSDEYEALKKEFGGVPTPEQLTKFFSKKESK